MCEYIYVCVCVCVCVCVYVCVHVTCLTVCLSVYVNESENGSFCEAGVVPVVYTGMCLYEFMWCTKSRNIGM